jgi:hypothetical protein
LNKPLRQIGMRYTTRQFVFIAVMKIIEIAEVHDIWIIKRTVEVKREREVLV